MSYFLSLPRELIYAIAAVDAGVYNVMLRLCRSIHSLFPLSTRLDFMEAFGVTVDITLKNGIWQQAHTQWRWGQFTHDVFGPAIRWVDGDMCYYYRGRRHRAGGPARVWKTHVTWYNHGARHRDLNAPAATGAHILCGYASIRYESDITVSITWYTYGMWVRELVVTGEDAAVARAEIDYWYRLN
jgi:hypothetical protein